jgi:hypothetical protein
MESNGRITCGWTRTGLEGNGSCLICCTILGYDWRCWQKPARQAEISYPSWLHIPEDSSLYVLHRQCIKYHTRKHRLTKQFAYRMQAVTARHGRWVAGLSQIYYHRMFNPSKTESLLNNIIHIQSSPYLTGNTLRLRYRDQPVNVVYGNSLCLLWEPYGTHKYSMWAKCWDFI